MVSLSKYLLIATVAVASAAEITSPAASRRFHPDDPLVAEPQPRPVIAIKARPVDALYDFVYNSFAERSVRVSPGKRELVRLRVNTMDEVPDSAWYTNRHAMHRMTAKELMRGPGNESPPEADRPWKVVGAKSDGVTPGFTIEDGQGRKYLLKFDPPRNPEMASAADVIGSKFFYALGYWTPENYIVRFRRDQLTIDPEAGYRDSNGNRHSLTARYLTSLLEGQPVDANGKYRAMASRLIPGQLLGPFRFKGVRGDDPNDVIPHEDRRDLRGLAVMAAWLNHTDMKSINTLDSLVEENGTRFVRHYLIDFGASLGSDSFAPKDARTGHEYFVQPKSAIKEIVTLGLIVPAWARVSYPAFASVGHFSAKNFAPEKWKTNYPNPAFSRMGPDDAFWAARQVMAFTDEDIRAVVSTGKYSDPAAAQYVGDTLIRRRDAVGKAYLKHYLPLDQFAVRNDRLTFLDLFAEHRLGSGQTYSVSWARFNNQDSRLTPIADASGSALPSDLRDTAPGEYVAATVQCSQARATTTVYLRRDPNGWTPVGIERTR